MSIFHCLVIDSTTNNQRSNHAQKTQTYTPVYLVEDNPETQFKYRIL